MITHPSRLTPNFMKPQDEGFNVAPCPAFELSRSEFQNCPHIATRRQLLPPEGTLNVTKHFLKKLECRPMARRLLPSTSIELYNIKSNLPLVYLLYRYLHAL